MSGRHGSLEVVSRAGTPRRETRWPAEDLRGDGMVSGNIGDDAAGATMQSDDTVRRALQALAEADASRHASPHVEGALLDAFERDKVRRSPPWAPGPAVR